MSYYSDWVHANCDPDDDDTVWCELCNEEMDTAWDEEQQDHIYVCSNEDCAKYNPKYFEEYPPIGQDMHDAIQWQRELMGAR